ncbi:MAG: hypothetical protein JF599_07005 [Verrucomicrobia bacterium]|nr:hypothetical protein [Verrucomicrobiota bacterium]
MKKSTISPSRRESRTGFTIIELLVSVGITALLVTLMLTIVTNVLNGWNRSSGSLVSGNQARTVLDQIAQDIQGAIIRNDTTNTWLVATIQKDQAGAGDAALSETAMTSSWTVTGGTGKPTAAAANGSFQINPPNLDWSEYKFGQAGVWLRLFSTPTAANSTADPTAPRAVSYQLMRVRVGSATANQYSYMFFRSEVTPTATFTAGYDLLGSSNYNTGVSTDGVAGNIRRPSSTRLIANNVIDFGVKIYGRVSATSGSTAVAYDVELFPVPRSPDRTAVKSIPTASNVPYSYVATGATTATTAYNSGNILLLPATLVSSYFNSYLASPKDPAGATLTNASLNAYPVAIEVMVRILTDEGARQIAALEAGNITGDWWQIANANSQVYTRRIEVKSLVP